MNRSQAIAELSSMQERADFLRAVIEATKPKPKPDAPYGCQAYNPNRLCRFDRRAISQKCDGCTRTTDKDYLASMGLWIEGVSHKGEA